MPDIKTGPRLVASVVATESGDWQVVSTPTGFNPINSSVYSDNDYTHGFVRFEDGEGWEEYDTDDATTDGLLQIDNITGTVTITRPATPYASSNSGDRVNAGAGTHTLAIALGSGTMKRIFREINGAWKTFTSGDATPSVAGYRLFTTAGTTAITAFDDMEDGKVFIVERGASDIVITHGASIVLFGAANLTLTASNPTAYFVNKSGVAKQVGGVQPILDEDDFASDSATRAPSQQSTAAFMASRFSTVLTGNTTLGINRRYLLNSTGGVFTVTLPASPAANSTVELICEASVSTNAVALDPNGATVNAESGTGSLNVGNTHWLFRFASANWTPTLLGGAV